MGPASKIQLVTSAPFGFTMPVSFALLTPTTAAPVVTVGGGKFAVLKVELAVVAPSPFTAVMSKSKVLLAGRPTRFALTGTGIVPSPTGSAAQSTVSSTEKPAL